MISHSCPTVGEEEAAAASSVVSSERLAQGRQVAAFEEEMADRLGRRYAVAVSSGTAALALTLRAMGVGQSPVLIPSYVCSALLQAAHHAGGRPLLADVDERDGNLDPSAISDASDPTIIVPLMFGQPADVRSIQEASRAHAGPP